MQPGELLMSRSCFFVCRARGGRGNDTEVEKQRERFKSFGLESGIEGLRRGWEEGRRKVKGVTEETR